MGDSVINKPKSNDTKVSPEDNKTNFNEKKATS